MVAAENNFLAAHGKQLIRNGYKIVPIKHGYKYPQGISRWESLNLRPVDVKSYAKAGYTGVGILTGSTCAVDIDVYDRETATKITIWCRDNLGARGVRIGQAPKVLIPFRTETPFKKACTASWYDVFGERASDGSTIDSRVEILGLGQQYVAFGIHPDTEEPYTWKGMSVLDIRRTDLPLLTQEGVTELFNYVNSIVPDNWEPSKDSREVRLMRVTDDDILLNATPQLDVTLSELQKSLDSIDPTDYQTWVTVGMALHHQYCGGHEGFRLWDTWSKVSTKYTPEEMWPKWKTFESDLTSKPVTAASILKMGRDTAKENMLSVGVESVEDDAAETLQNNPKKDEDETFLEMFLDRYVYVVEGDRVADLRKPPQHSVIKLSEFKNLTAPVRESISSGVKGGSKMVSVWSSWMVDPHRKTAQGSTYEPGGPRIVSDAWRLKWINEFHSPKFKPTTKVNLMRVFTEHIDYLFPIKVEREWFLDWLAFNVQKPKERCKVTPLHVSMEQGTGRGWVVEFLQALLGPWNVTKTKMSELAGDGKFLNAMARSLLCAVEEVKERGGKFEINDKIRDLLTEKHLEINMKYGQKGTVQVYCNFFFMTNHADALILPPEDRRINVFTGPDKPRPMKYYDKLYAFLEDRAAVAQAYSWLMRRSLTNFNWKRSMHTPARDNMIGANYTDTESSFREWLCETNIRVFTMAQLPRILYKELDMDSMDSDLDEAALRYLVKAHCVSAGPVRLPSPRGTKRLWAVKENQEITKDYLKTEYVKTLAFLGEDR